MGVFIPLPIRVPSFIKWMHPSWYIWDKSSLQKTIYLTFDDGPIPEITEWVLDILAQKKVKATFFCIGDNVQKHPAIFKKVIAQNHSIGNHTQNHVKGWHTKTGVYIDNIAQAEKTMSSILTTLEGQKQTINFPLFRPPFGKIKRTQAQKLRKKGYQIIMYRTIAYDWEATVTPEQCLQNVIKNTRSGDLIVFHDSIKASRNMKYVLPKAIDHFLEKGYRFEVL